MNARQKAKHFKRLYENNLPKKPYPIVYQSPKKHYEAQLMIDKRNLLFPEEDPFFKTHIENCMLDKLRPIIWNNLTVEKDIRRDLYVYRLDVWV